MNFEQILQQWVSIDNQIKIYSDKLKDLRNKKNIMEEKLKEHPDSSKLNSIIPISDGRLKFVNTKVTSPLTFKYLEKSLGEIIRNSEQVKVIINHIKNNRESKIVPELKRFYYN